MKNFPEKMSEVFFSNYLWRSLWFFDVILYLYYAKYIPPIGASMQTNRTWSGNAIITRSWQRQHPLATWLLYSTSFLLRKLLSITIKKVMIGVMRTIKGKCKIFYKDQQLPKCYSKGKRATWQFGSKKMKRKWGKWVIRVNNWQKRWWKAVEKR